MSTLLPPSICVTYCTLSTDLEATSNDTEAFFQDSEKLQEEPVSVTGEVEELRSENEKHYRLSDGSYIAVDYGMPVHYAQGDGEHAVWMDIDNTLSAAAAQMSTGSTPVYTAINGSEVKSFASVFTPDGYLFSSRMGAYEVSMSLMQETTAHQLLAAANQELTEESESAVQEATVPAETTLPTKDTSDSEASLPSEETTPDPGTEVQEATAPPEASADEGTQPETGASGLPEEEGQETTAPTAPAEDSLAQETEPTAPVEPTQVPTEETAPTASLEPTAPSTEEAAQPQNSEFPTESAGIPPAGLLQQSQAQVINPGSEIMPLSLDDADSGEISEQVELSKLSSTVLYPDILPGVDLQYDTIGLNIKESIIVNELQTSYTYRFRLSLSDLTPAAQEDGSILLNNANGEAIYKIPAPYMVDANCQVSYDVWYDLAEVADGYLLTVTADPAWIHQEGRALPVTIDPALIVAAGNVNDDIVTNFVSQEYPGQKYNGSQLYMGNQGGTNKNLNAYLYFKTLPTIPANCSVVGATVSLYKMDYSHVGMSKFYGQIRQVTGDKPSGYSNYTSWIYDINWNTAPAYSETVEDYAELYSAGSTGKYIDWDISRAVCNWYTDPTINNRTLAITPYAPTGFTSTNYACTAYYTFTNTRRPMFIVYYRNNVGLEGYYTYQTISAGRAGTGYISDYTSQLTLANTLVSSSSNTMPFSITAYYNSANGNHYFADSDVAGIHTVNYSGMKCGAGWKLSIQESIRQITVKTEDASIEYYVYNDADGSEHYFQITGKSSPYEDEDGLNLSLKVDGSKFILTDKKDNVKEFYNGYLTKIGDADGNAIYLLYNGKEYSAGSNTWKPTSGSANYISKIIRINDNGEAADVPVTLFTLAYSNNLLVSITDAGGRKTHLYYDPEGGLSRLKRITFPDNVSARYIYNSENGTLLKAYDEEAKVGVGLTYRNFQGTLCVEKVREFAAASVTGTETVGSQWHLWVYSPNMKEYRFYGPDQKKDTADDTVVRYTFDHTGKTVNIVNFNTDRSHILGVSNASYTANSKTKTKNRLSGAAATGYLAQNRLNNSGFEKSNTSGYPWVEAVSEQSSQVSTAFRNSIPEVSPALKPHTGNYLLKTYIKGEKVSTTEDGSSAGMYQRVYLQKSIRYTLSAWASTAGVTRYGKDGGMILQFRNDSGAVLAASELLNYQTSQEINNGWTRLEVSYTPDSSGWYRIYAIQRNASAFGAFDDMQLEETKSDVSESGASTANLVQIGSFELWNGATADCSLNSTYWTKGPGEVEPKTEGAREGYSMSIQGAITDKCRASQVIPIYQTSDSTYILSGWAQAHSAPNCASATDMKGDNSESKRFFGLIAKVDYTDGTAADYHYVPFDCNYTDWQYASASVVPKQRNKTVSTITVITAYDYNVNVGHFDDISLVEEPAQTYTYDDEGNLKATTSTGNSDETFQYDGADLIDQTAGGYGSYHYEYKNHNMIKATNDGVSVTADYDEAGNSTGTKLQKSDGTGLYLQTHATYTAEKDHTASVTDANGGTTTFAYDSLGRNTSTSTPIDTGVTSTTEYSYVSGNDRQYRTSNSAGGVLYYGYTNGVQAEASRYSKDSQARPWQRYHLTLDAWGNTTKIQVQSATGGTPTSWLTGPTLASYEYAGNNGYLSKMTHANGDYETYTYDRYGRVVTIGHYTQDGSLSYSEIYVYDGNGNTGRCKVVDSSHNILDDYRYEYDSLGRLIRSSQVSGGKTVLRTEHIYDADNRMTKQSYQIGSKTFTEKYSYNNNDGSMTSMTAANGDNLNFSYDSIKRLYGTAAKTGSTLHYLKEYGYRTISGNQTTTQVSSLAYSGFTGAPTYRYAYTANGNIKSVQLPNKNSITYTYDTQGQLITAVDEDWATTFHYTYDTAGNILTKNAWRQYGDNEEIAFSYDNASWPDLLTAVNGQRIAYEGQTFNADTGAVSGTVKSGNPISYFNGDTRWNFTWENGRQLATATTTEGNTETSISYAYDLNGLRTEKTVTTKTYAVVQHTVTFVANGKTVKTMTVDDGYVLQDSDYPAIPERDGYRGEWDTYTSPITSNMTIQANYIAIWHTVKFVANGVTVKTITVDVGYVLKAADYPEIPIRVGYVSSWNQYTGPITSNITIQASYVRSDHLVRFIDDGTLVKTMTVGHGYVLKDWDYPELPEVAGYHVSWNKYSEPITADLVVWANYAVAPHTVTFVADGVTIKTMEVEDGYVLTDGDYPAVPEKEGYWGSWNVQTAPITQDTTIRAVYRLAHMNTVTFVASGKTVKTLSVPDGYTLKSSDYPEVPPKTGYDGKWNQYTAPVTADITIQAVYTPGTPVPTLPTDPGDLMSLEDEMPTEAEESEEPEAAASEEVAATSSSPAMRLVSTVTEQHSYIYASGRLLRETITTTAADGTVTTEVLDFAYDAQGTPYSLTYTNGTASPVTYYYITNLQGDVMQLIDSAGETKATYSYDPYGQVLLANGAMAEINPLQYRGYYFDADTEFYYLQSRYYDPEICRFVNYDRYASTGNGFIGQNMFSYCNNNSITYIDRAGYRALGPTYSYVNDGGSSRPNPIVPAGSYAGGDVYIVLPGQEEDVQSLKTGDVIVVDYRANNEDPNVSIQDSYRIECIDLQLEIIDIILEYTSKFPVEGWDRDRQDMLYEWGYHNNMYILDLFPERSSGVDLNANDENKPFFIKMLEVGIDVILRKVGDIFG